MFCEDQNVEFQRDQMMMIMMMMIMMMMMMMIEKQEKDTKCRKSLEMEKLVAGRRDVWKDGVSSCQAWKP